MLRWTFQIRSLRNRSFHSVLGAASSRASTWFRLGCRLSSVLLRRPEWCWVSLGVVFVMVFSRPRQRRSPNEVKLHEWHAVRVTRTRREGSLQLDDGPTVHGESSVSCCLIYPTNEASRALAASGSSENKRKALVSFSKFPKFTDGTGGLHQGDTPRLC